MNKVVLVIALLYFPLVFSQSKEEIKRQNQIDQLLYEAEKSIQQGDFPAAEAAYRKVIAMDQDQVVARYNLGSAFYQNQKNMEAGKQFVDAAEKAQTKDEKHRVFHNLGNTLMREKNYAGAVEAYKNALRNNPQDDETRYNLALAKKLLEEHGGGGGEDQEQDQNQDQQQDEQNPDQGENQEDNQGGNDSQDQPDQGDSGDDQEQQQSQPDDNSEQQQEQPDAGEVNQQAIEGQLSQQQIQSLLEAIENEDKKAQDKINAEKQKGVPVKPEKDW